MPKRSPPTPTPPEKTCPTCGRRFQWRRKWVRNWDSVKYCSAACRRGTGPAGDRAERAILALLERRSTDASICPSEAARELARPETAASVWRPLMSTIHDAARRLAVRGEIEITRNGRSLDPTQARGAVRLRLRIR